MRRLLLIAVAIVVIGLGCEKKEDTSGPKKDMPPRMLKPGEKSPAASGTTP